jgi:uncharacterized membrane protein (DUF2068 family)
MAPPNYFLPLKTTFQPQRRRGDGWMRLVAVGRFIYGVVLLAAGLTIFILIGKDLTAGLSKLINKWHLDAHLVYIHWLMKRIPDVSHGLLVLLTVMTFFYAALAFIEGLGLMAGKRWAYWLVIWDTASFIPVEIFRLCKEFGWINFGLLLFYTATVIYLLLQIARKPQLNSDLILSPLLTPQQN